ncbi:hypothetical protein BDAP_000416 [Binucleata daphniae]
MTNSLSQNDLVLYDRQIRLFGYETQYKIKNLKIKIFAYKNNFCAGEIIKNFALLGVTEMKMNKLALESFDKISVNSLSEINEAIKVTIESEDNKENVSSNENNGNNEILYDNKDSNCDESVMDNKKYSNGVSVDNDITINNDDVCSKVNDEQNSNIPEQHKSNVADDQSNIGTQINDELNNCEESSDDIKTTKITKTTSIINNLKNIKIIVDSCKRNTTNDPHTFYLCSSCLSFSVNVIHKCQKKSNGCKTSLECLLGSIFVQEIVKMINNEKALNEFVLNI